MVLASLMASAWVAAQIAPTQLVLAPPRRPRPSVSRPATEEAAGQQPSVDGQTTQPATAPATSPLLPSTDRRQPPADPPMSFEEHTPLGFAGPSTVRWRADRSADDFIPIPDRWRIGQPSGYVQNVHGSPVDPYNQNILKGDYPVLGQDIFLSITATSDTTFEARNVPVPSGVSTLDSNSLGFFGDGDQLGISQNVILSFSLFKGDAGYKPRDWEVRLTPVFNVNYAQASELGLLAPDVQEGRTRNDSWIGFQEAFVEYRLPVESKSFDFASVRAGIQGFTSDFRGFLFSDNEPGIRVFGNLYSNRIQWNLAWFHALEKNTNSGLNSYTLRDQDVFIANVFVQDALEFLRRKTTDPDYFGYTALFSFHANLDEGDRGDGIKLDDNGGIVRPAPVGTIGEKSVHAYYLGFGGDGHIGRVNLSHQFYQALGTESFNPIAGDDVNINAQFFAIELSYDADWLRYRASFAYASGDSNPTDGQATGFDTIFDNPNFAGGGFNYFTRQAIRLTGSGVGLNQRNSFVPNLRTSKEQGQANFVNPGLLLFNLGVDAEVTPRLKAISNVSYLMFDNTDTLELVLNDNKIGRAIGIDYSLGVQYRPFLNNQCIFIFGAAALQPMGGFKDIYSGETLYSIFTSAVVSY